MFQAVIFLKYRYCYESCGIFVAKFSNPFGNTFRMKELVQYIHGMHMGDASRGPHISARVALTCGDMVTFTDTVQHSDFRTSTTLTISIEIQTIITTYF